MKAVMYFFSLWIMLLTGLPCPDAECHAQSDHTTSASASQSPDDPDHGHKAPCSPFCHCTTCLGFSIPRPLSHTLPTVLSILIPTSQEFAYQSPNQADVALTIWQPPKL